MASTASSILPASLALPADRDILVYIFQRGAADGLNALAPYGDSDYYTHRPSIAVAPGDVIDLDGFFGLHPALAPLQPIYAVGDLALVHATGVPHGSRSHFAAQGLVERGVADKAGPTSGWLGRHLAAIPPASGSAFRIVSISGNVPVSLTGADEPLAISNIGEFGFDQEIVDAGYPAILDALFHAPVPFSGPAQAALAAIGELRAADPASITPANGAVYPDTDLGRKLKQVGQIIRSDLPVEVVCLDSEGWDHHESLPTYIQQSLSELAGALSAFYTDMGTGMARITVLVHTEFGRRIAQNASQGTDHGTAGLAYVMGGGVNGGQVVSDWPGLNILDNEDLQITTDLRSVQAELLVKRLGASPASLNDIFPDFTLPTFPDVFLDST